MRIDTVAALADAEPRVYWLDTPDRPASRPALQASTRTDLAVVGGGFTGLWTALRAKERDPGRDVVLLEGERVGWAASGRNGGFCAASLTHGEANGRERFPDEYADAGAAGPGEPRRDRGDGAPVTASRATSAAPARWTSRPRTTRSTGCASSPRPGGGEFLDEDAVRAELRSPTYKAGVWDRDGTALVDPAALAWGLAAAAEAAGVRVARAHTGARGHALRDGLALRTANGPTVHADRVALGTNAFPPCCAACGCTRSRSTTTS